MTYEQKQIKARDRRYRVMDSIAVRVSTVKSVRGTVTPCGKTFARPVRATWPECDAQRRFIAYAKGYGVPWLAGTLKPSSSGSGVTGARATRSDPAGIAPRLQSVRGHALSVELRPIQVRREAWNVQVHRLHGRLRIMGQSANGRKTSAMATCQKNANGSPATGRDTPKTSRHGTKPYRKTSEIGHNVPPRDETPCFWGGQRPATGHLYRLTICSNVSKRIGGTR